MGCIKNNDEVGSDCFGSRQPRRWLPQEVIHPQLPLRIPCYDFSPLAKPGLDSATRRSLVQTSLGWSDGRCVQGAGTYSPPDGDRRLLGIPRSWGRVTAPNPNYDPVSGLPPPFGVGTHCPGHCSPRVARGIRGIRTYRRPHLPPAYRRRSP